MLVELDEGGRISRGEASPDPFFKETTESLEADVRGALDLVPADASDLATLKLRLDERFPHGGAAACALDILGHDRAAQAAGVPLRSFLGLAGREAPPTSFTIGIAEPSRHGRARRGRRGEGVRGAQGQARSRRRRRRDPLADTRALHRDDPRRSQCGVDARRSAGAHRAHHAVRHRVRGAAHADGRHRWPALRARAVGAADRRRRGGGASSGRRPLVRRVSRHQRETAEVRRASRRRAR